MEESLPLRNAIRIGFQDATPDSGQSEDPAGSPCPPPAPLIGAFNFMAPLFI